MLKRGLPTLAAVVFAAAISGSAAAAATDVAECPVPAADGLTDVRGSDAGPYLLSEPEVVDDSTATVIFLPGGGASQGAAALTWERFFEAGAGFEGLRVIIPYSDSGNLFSETTRTLDIIDEVLSCAGGDPLQVHLGGTSNGGVAAFGLMLEQPERFATLLGAPGLFPSGDPASLDPQVLADTFAGRAVFDGVGELDDGWKPGVVATISALEEAGIESVLVEFPGQGHIPEPGFDSSVLRDFWESH